MMREFLSSYPLRGLEFLRFRGPVQRPPRYSILNDPDTGVRLPDEENQAEGCTHITLVSHRESACVTASRTAQDDRRK